MQNPRLLRIVERDPVDDASLGPYDRARHDPPVPALPSESFEVVDARAAEIRRQRLEVRFVALYRNQRASDVDPNSYCFSRNPEKYTK